MRKPGKITKAFDLQEYGLVNEVSTHTAHGKRLILYFLHFLSKMNRMAEIFVF